MTSRPCLALLAAFVTFVHCWAIAASAEVGPSWSIPADVKTKLINGYWLAYKDEGQGTAIVFIHGANADYRSFGPQIAALASSHRVVVPSLRHYYPEHWNGEGSDFSVEQHAADVAALIKTLGLGQVHLVGWSRGGAVAIEIAKSHPELARSLVMEDGLIEMPLQDTPERGKAAELRAENDKAIQQQLLAGNPTKAAEVLVDSLTEPGGWQRLPEPRKQVVVDNIYTALGDKRARPSTSCSQLKAFHFPVLLMTAEKSPKRYATLYREMINCAAFADPIVIPSAGHNIHGGNADAYNRALLTFVAKSEQN
ncbi:alpha/beta fold hydrolase [Bradyrhizobium sp.]|uniref:alpha/beta fold hydrolase n=1 Tax=Bradyrhizobium sp. TaxID=376 RepID=UPI000A0650CF|nr:alpha/beta hydrolase [Bradyrhizobium sp.]